jgi:hypothetical protein
MTLQVTFQVPGSKRTAEGQLALDRMAEALVQLNVDYLRAHPDTPKLADSGVRYDLGADVQGPWLTIPMVLAAGRGDCEDLAAWRVAELRVQGVDAHMCALHWNTAWESGAGKWGIHWKVCRPDRSAEDPSEGLATWAPAVGGRPSDLVWLAAAFFGTLIAVPVAYAVGARNR